MSTITAILEPDADGTLHLPVPSEWAKIPILIKAEMEPAGKAPGMKQLPLDNLKGFGCLRGKIQMSPDFDAPLEDFKDYTA